MRIAARPFLGRLVLASLALLAWRGPAFASDVQPLAHPAGSPPGATANSKSFLVSAVSGSNTPNPTCFSADGRFVAFASWSGDLIPGLVVSALASVYVTDLTTGSTTLVSHKATDPLATGNQSSSVPAISADGRWIAYWSTATDLVPGQTSTGASNIFLFDRTTGVSTLVSRRAGALPLAGGNADSFSPLLSADGRFVAFLSQATNLVPEETLRHDAIGFDLFLFDRDPGTTTLVSHRSGFPARTGNGTTFWHALSADGRFLAFSSMATDLVSEQVDTAATADVFLFDRIAARTSLVSHAAGSSATAGNGESTEASISADGRFVAYASYATDVVPGMVDSDGPFGDVFLFDRTSGSNSLVSHAPNSPNTTADSGSFQARISADGSAVAYTSLSTTLVAGASDPNGLNLDVFVLDRASGVNTLVSRSAAAAPETGNAESLNPVISANGSRIAFQSLATDLVPGQVDTNGWYDVFLYDRSSGKTELVSRAPASPATTGDAASSGVLLSADGNLVAFNSDAGNLVAADANTTMDAFLFRQVSFGSATAFTPLPPCRLVDTRAGGGDLGAMSTREFVLSGLCGVPPDAVSVSVNVTVPQAAAAGFVDVFPAGLAVPETSLVSFSAGQTRANNAVVSLGGTPSGSVSVRNASAGPAHVVVDVNGYYR